MQYREISDDFIETNIIIIKNEVHQELKILKTI